MSYGCQLTVNINRHRRPAITHRMGDQASECSGRLIFGMPGKTDEIILFLVLIFGGHMDIRYMYKGTEFIIREFHPVYDRPYSNVVDLISYGDEVCIPSEVNGYKIKGLRFPSPDSVTDSDREDF